MNEQPSLRDQLIDTIAKLTPLEQQPQIAALKETAIRYLSNPLNTIALEDLRKTANQILTAEEKIPDGNPTCPASVAHEILLILACWHPKNDTDNDGNIEDPITYNPIKKERRFYLSTGYCFDMDSILGFRATSGLFKDPFTNLPYRPRDQQHIKKFSKKYSLNAESKNRSVPARPQTAAAQLHIPRFEHLLPGHAFAFLPFNADAEFVERIIQIAENPQFPFEGPPLNSLNPFDFLGFVGVASEHQGIAAQRRQAEERKRIREDAEFAEQMRRLERLEKESRERARRIEAELDEQIRQRLGNNPPDPNPNPHQHQPHAHHHQNQRAACNFWQPASYDEQIKTTFKLFGASLALLTATFGTGLSSMLNTLTFQTVLNSLHIHISLGVTLGALTLPYALLLSALTLVLIGAVYAYFWMPISQECLRPSV